MTKMESTGHGHDKIFGPTSCIILKAARNPTTEMQDAAKRNSVAESQSTNSSADGKKSNSGCVPSSEYLHRSLRWTL